MYTHQSILIFVPLCEEKDHIFCLLRSDYPGAFFRTWSFMLSGQLDFKKKFFRFTYPSRGVHKTKKPGNLSLRV